MTAAAEMGVKVAYQSQQINRRMTRKWTRQVDSVALIGICAAGGGADSNRTMRCRRSCRPPAPEEIGCWKLMGQRPDLKTAAGETTKK